MRGLQNNPAASMSCSLNETRSKEQNTINFGTILRWHYGNIMIERLLKESGEEGSARGGGL